MDIKNATKDHYLPSPFQDCPQLSNALLAIAKYRNRLGNYWPTKIIVRTTTRVTISFGQDIPLECTKWPQLDMFYMSMFKPEYERPTHRERTKIPKKRKPVSVNGLIRTRMYKNDYKVKKVEEKSK